MNGRTVLTPFQHRVLSNIESGRGVPPDVRRSSARRGAMAAMRDAKWITREWVPHHSQPGSMLARWVLTTLGRQLLVETEAHVRSRGEKIQ